MGHCLLRTTEEALHEKQPLANEDASVVLVIDGTLWNSSELKCKLMQAGARLRTSADSELVLRAYELWGRNCLAQIDGDFAFAIYDRRTRQVFCARDRVGMRPFHWHHSSRHGFCFASDPEALLALPGMPSNLNEARIAHSMIWGLEGTDHISTFYSEVFRLAPAHQICVDHAGPSISSYWKFEPQDWPVLRSDREAEESFKAILGDAVRRRLRGRSTTGATLSGGLDFKRNLRARWQVLCSGWLPAAQNVFCRSARCVLLHRNAGDPGCSGNGRNQLPIYRLQSARASCPASD